MLIYKSDSTAGTPNPEIIAPEDECTRTRSAFHVRKGAGVNANAVPFLHWAGAGSRHWAL